MAPLGERRQVREGEYLYREGDVAYDFFVLVSAEVDIVVTVDGVEQVIVHHGSGRFLGDLNMLSGLRVFVSARVVVAGEVIVISRDRLRQLMATQPRLGNTILAAFGGNSAGQAANFLGQVGCAATLVIRASDLGKDMSRYLTERIEADPRITIRTDTTVVALDGDETMRAVHLDGPNGSSVVPCAGPFSFIGADPASGWLDGCAALDDRGFVLTDLSLGPDQLDGTWQTLDRSPLPFETSHPGPFAVGDVRSGSMKRVASAVGEGSASVRSVHEYLAF